MDELAGDRSDLGVLAGVRPASAPNGQSRPLASPPIRRRRTLPGSRAVVGGLLIAAASVGLFAASSHANRGPQDSYLVASRPLEVGTRLQPSDIRAERMELPASLRSRAFDDPGALADATVVAPLAAGELVQSSAVVAQGGEASTRELSFPVEGGLLSASVKEGERVDILATFGTGDQAFTDVVVRQAVVVSIQRPRGSLGDAGTAVVAVALDDPEEPLALAHAIALGKLTVVRATGAGSAPESLPSYRHSTEATSGGGSTDSAGSS